MASRYEVEVTVTSAKELKNVNWRHGPNRPYAVVWVDPARKCSTRVDEEGDTFPVWEQTLTIPLQQEVPIEDQTLFVDVVHANAEEDTSPLIGSAKLRLRDVLDDAGFGERVKKSLQLKRPSGRPQGKIDVKVLIRENRYQSRDAYYAPPYGVPAQKGIGEWDYFAAAPAPAPAPAYATPYAQPQNPYYAAAPPSGYPYSAPPPVQSSYGYGGQQPGVGVGVGEEKNKSKFGMGTGLAVGAVAGVLGGVALAEGVDALEDHIADEAADRVEDDLGYDDSGDW